MKKPKSSSALDSDKSLSESTDKPAVIVQSPASSSITCTTPSEKASDMAPLGRREESTRPAIETRSSDPWTSLDTLSVIASPVHMTRLNARVTQPRQDL